MKITIIGPGAIGCLYYGLLSKKAASLYLLDKDLKRVEYLQANGIKIEGLTKLQVIPKITTSIKETANSDLVIIAVKAYDTSSAAKLAKEICSDNGFVLSVQNGLGNLDVLSEVVGYEKVLGGVTEQSAILSDKGKLIHTGDGYTLIGKQGKKLPAGLRQIRELFNSCGVKTKISKDINSAIWSKLIVNVGINALTALVRIQNADILDYDSCRSLMRMAVSEAERVAKRKKVKFPFDSAIDKVEAVCRATGDNISSMLQDIINKKRTEIEYINGAVFKLGQNLNIPTPVNFMLFELIKTIENSFQRQVL